jgi:hypothetical protein
MKLLRIEDHPARRAGRCPVVAESPPSGKSRYDYADAFEVTLPESDGRTAEQIVRAGLEHAPPALRSAIRTVHQHLLRFDLAPASSPEHIVGWRITTSEPDMFLMEASGPLIDAAIVARRIGERTARLTTFVVYRQRTLAMALFVFVAPVHRQVAAYLMERAASHAESA